MTAAYLHILVIDDDPRRAARLTRPFAAWGWGATVVGGDPATALAALHAAAYDLVLLDIAAAERDDGAFLAAWRTDPAGPPVVVTAQPGTALGRLARVVERGASDYLTHPANKVLLRARLQNVLQKKLLSEQANAALESFNEIEKIADDLRLVILPIGAALSNETDYDRLVGRIVEEALGICHADAGVLFLADDDNTLHYTFARIKSLDQTYGTFREPMPFPPVPLADPDTGGPNLNQIAGYVALLGESVNLPDVHTSERFDFTQLRAFEQANDYTALSCLTVPLRNGQVVGALLLLNSTDPHTGAIVPFDAYHQQVAESLASQAAVVLNNRVLNERQASLLRVKREIEIGREIQRSFLPTAVPDPPGWEVQARFWPAQEVAGDFYDLIELPHGHLGLVLADVVGKGVTAALFMAIIRSLYRALFQQYYYNVEAGPRPTAAQARMTPFSFVDREALLNAVRLTNAYLLGNHAETYTFATLFAGLLDPGTGRLLYVNAGHIPPYLLVPDDAGGQAIRARLQPTGPAVGLLPDRNYWVAETVLAPGGWFYAHTDGVTDARSPSGEEFGADRLEAVLRAPAPKAAALIDHLGDALAAHTSGAPPYDDITMIALRRHPDAAAE
jgi:sigma-B regulation protein RsbU (phosphoserine phosphatase)